MNNDKRLTGTDIAVYALTWFIVLLGFIDEVAGFYFKVIAPHLGGGILAIFLELVIGCLQIFRINSYAAVAIASFILVMYMAIRVFHSIEVFYGILIGLLLLACTLFENIFYKKMMLYFAVPQLINYIIYLLFKEGKKEKQRRLARRMDIMR